MSAPTPWAAWMRIGLGVMRLPPEAFWALSLREWTLALEGFPGMRGVAVVAPLTRHELEHLIEADRRNFACHPRTAAGRSEDLQQLTENWPKADSWPVEGGPRVPGRALRAAPGPEDDR